MFSLEGKSQNHPNKAEFCQIFQILAVRTNRSLLFCSALWLPALPGLQMEGSTAEPGTFSLILLFVPQSMGHNFTGPSSTFS